jgi:hypothetical protein
MCTRARGMGSGVLYSQLYVYHLITSLAGAWSSSRFRCSNSVAVVQHRPLHCGDTATLGRCARNLPTVSRCYAIAEKSDWSVPDRLIPGAAVPSLT